MARGKGTIRRVEPGRRTCAALYSKPGDENVVNWDKIPGYAQHTEQARTREAMGQKLTPVGRTTLFRS